MPQLSVGDQAPNWTLLNDKDEEVSLSDFAGKTVVFYAYPRAMTPGCTTQACDFRDSLDALNAAGVTVIGISPDKPASLAKFRDKDALAFTLVSDPDKEVLAEYGFFGEKKNYGKVVQGVIRSTVVIGPDGKIEHALYNVKAKGHVGRLRDLLGV
ncbi:MAG: thioredoxin-dependent thiol peroxidase [Actinomycetia bacterium]|nr:thioredoxin-dependent thiol peroxidase [Actinomycetes bacterium]